MNNLAKYNDFKYHIENTGGDINFYYYLFNQIIEKKLENIHFCFDVGHALLGTQHSIENWKLFLNFLISNNKKLHFHIHTNNGFEDSHLIPIKNPSEYVQERYSSYCENYPLPVLDLGNYFEGTKIIEANPNIYNGKEIIEKISLLNLK